MNDLHSVGSNQLHSWRSFELCLWGFYMRNSVKWMLSCKIGDFISIYITPSLPFKRKKKRGGGSLIKGVNTIGIYRTTWDIHAPSRVNGL